MSYVVRVARDPSLGTYWILSMNEINLVCGWVVTPYGQTLQNLVTITGSHLLCTLYER